MSDEVKEPVRNCPPLTEYNDNTINSFIKNTQYMQRWDELSSPPDNWFSYAKQWPMNKERRDVILDGVIQITNADLLNYLKGLLDTVVESEAEGQDYVVVTLGKLRNAMRDPDRTYMLCQKQVEDVKFELAKAEGNKDKEDNIYKVLRLLIDVARVNRKYEKEPKSSKLSLSHDISKRLKGVQGNLQKERLASVVKIKNEKENRVRDSVNKLCNFAFTEEDDVKEKLKAIIKELQTPISKTEQNLKVFTQSIFNFYQSTTTPTTTPTTTATTTPTVPFQFRKLNLYERWVARKEDASYWKNFVQNYVGYINALKRVNRHLVLWNTKGKKEIVKIRNELGERQQDWNEYTQMFELDTTNPTPFRTLGIFVQEHERIQKMQPFSFRFRVLSALLNLSDSSRRFMLYTCVTKAISVLGIHSNMVDEALVIQEIQSIKSFVSMFPAQNLKNELDIKFDTLFELCDMLKAPQTLVLNDTAFEEKKRSIVDKLLPEELTIVVEIKNAFNAVKDLANYIGTVKNKKVNGEIRKLNNEQVYNLFVQQVHDEYIANKITSEKFTDLLTQGSDVADMLVPAFLQTRLIESVARFTDNDDEKTLISNVLDLGSAVSKAEDYIRVSEEKIKQWTDEHKQKVEPIRDKLKSALEKAKKLYVLNEPILNNKKAALQAELNALREDNAQATAEKDLLSTTIDEKRNEIERIQTQISVQDRALQEKTSAVTSLEQKIIGIDAKILGLESDAGMIGKDIEIKSAEVHKLELDKNAMASEKAKLAEAIHKLSVEKGKVEATKTQVERELAALKITIQNLAGDISELSVLKDRFDEMIVKERDQEQSTISKLADLQAQNAEKAERISQLERALKGTEDIIVVLDSNNKNRDNAVDAMIHSLESDDGCSGDSEFDIMSYAVDEDRPHTKIALYLRTLLDIYGLEPDVTVKNILRDHASKIYDSLLEIHKRLDPSKRTEKSERVVDALVRCVLRRARSILIDAVRPESIGIAVNDDTSVDEADTDTTDGTDDRMIAKLLSSVQWVVSKETLNAWKAETLSDEANIEKFEDLVHRAIFNIADLNLLVRFVSWVNATFSDSNISSNLTLESNVADAAKAIVDKIKQKAHWDDAQEATEKMKIEAIKNYDSWKAWILATQKSFDVFVNVRSCIIRRSTEEGDVVDWPEYNSKRKVNYGPFYNVYNAQTKPVDIKGDLVQLMKDDEPRVFMYAAYGLSGSGKTTLLLNGLQGKNKKYNQVAVLKQIVDFCEENKEDVEASIDIAENYGEIDDGKCIVEADNGGTFSYVKKFRNEWWSTTDNTFREQKPSASIRPNEIFDVLNNVEKVRVSDHEIPGSTNQNVFEEKHIRETPYNKQSSRSHLAIVVKMKKKYEKSAAEHRVVVLDMGGSENVDTIQSMYFEKTPLVIFEKDKLMDFNNDAARFIQKLSSDYDKFSRKQITLEQLQADTWGPVLKELFPDTEKFALLQGMNGISFRKLIANNSVAFPNIKLEMFSTIIPEERYAELQSASLAIKKGATKVCEYILHLINSLPLPNITSPLAIQGLSKYNAMQNFLKSVKQETRLTDNEIDALVKTVLNQKTKPNLKTFLDTTEINIKSAKDTDTINEIIRYFHCPLRYQGLYINKTIGAFSNYANSKLTLPDKKSSSDAGEMFIREFLHVMACDNRKLNKLVVFTCLPSIDESDERDRHVKHDAITSSLQFAHCLSPFTTRDGSNNFHKCKTMGGGEVRKKRQRGGDLDSDVARTIAPTRAHLLKALNEDKTTDDYVAILNAIDDIKAEDAQKRALLRKAVSSLADAFQALGTDDERRKLLQRVSEALRDSDIGLVLRLRSDVKTALTASGGALGVGIDDDDDDDAERKKRDDKDDDDDGGGAARRSATTKDKDKDAAAPAEVDPRSSAKALNDAADALQDAETTFKRLQTQVEAFKSFVAQPTYDRREAGRAFEGVYDRAWIKAFKDWREKAVQAANEARGAVLSAADGDTVTSPTVLRERRKAAREQTDALVDDTEEWVSSVASLYEAARARAQTQREAE